MTKSSLRVTDGRKAFEPGETIQLVAEWACSPAPERAEVRLLWYTRGKGDTDRSLVDTITLDAPQANDRRTVKLHLPEAPYSFSGTLISLIWAVRLELFGAAKSKQIDIVVSPLSCEVVLNTWRPPSSIVGDDHDDDDGEDDDPFDGTRR
ncbi:MAG: hypothetical protein KF708_23180 [Pirellulales bacterium]|nr:hypothetical protein [Pirellulales bacterium]